MITLSLRFTSIGFTLGDLGICEAVRSDDGKWLYVVRRSDGRVCSGITNEDDLIPTIRRILENS